MKHWSPVARWGWISLPILVAVALALPWARLKHAAPTLTSIRDVRAFLRDAPQGDREIELRGTATHLDHGRGLLYLQDRTGALAIEIRSLGGLDSAQQSILLSGTLDGGSSRPRLRHAQVTVLGPADPEWVLDAHRIDAASLRAGDAEAEWVEVHGRVLSTKTSGQALVMEVDENGRRFTAQIPNHDPQYPPIVGARVRLRGVSVMRPKEGALPGPPVDLVVPQSFSLRIEKDPPAETSAEPGASASSLRVLTTVAEIRELSRSEAAKHYPVRLHAVVTLNVPQMSDLFVQDSTAGIYVEAWRHLHDVQPGDRVEIEGRTAPGGFAPIVDYPRVRVLGHGSLPEPRRIRLEELATGQLDSQWIEVEGTVRAIRPRHFGSEVTAVVGATRIAVNLGVAADPALAARLVGARVRIHGVACTVKTSESQLADVVLNVSDPTSFTVLNSPAADPFAQPVRPVSNILQFSPGPDWERQVRVQGTVIYSEPGHVYLVDDAAGIHVQSDGPPPVVGDVVDAVGFATAGDYTPILQDAEIRRIRRGLAQAPATITPADGLSGRYDARLVTLEGRLLDRLRGGDEQHLLMRAGPYLFTAVLRGSALEDVRPGSDLRLTGVCAVGRTLWRTPETFRLLLRTPADVQTLRAASWWTPRHATWVVATMMGVIGLSLAWVITLRRRVRAQSTFLWQRVTRETEIRERQRIARDLHDTLEQNLAGILLTVQAAQRALPARSPIERHLALILRGVFGGIDELQRAVWALREEALETRGLASALDDIGKQLTNCSDSPVEVVTHVEGDPHPFPATVENDLLRIGQEAITNAVRHGKASHIEMHLDYGAETFRLRVSDDGRGFDANVPTPAGHFGLLGMRERAAAIGARLEVRSAVNHGTQVEVALPLPRLRLPQAG